MKADNFSFSLLSPASLTATQGDATVGLTNIVETMSSLDLFSITVASDQTVTLKADTVKAVFYNQPVTFNFSDQIASVGTQVL